MVDNETSRCCSRKLPMGFDDFSALDAPFDKIQIQSKLTESMSEEGSRIYGIPAEYTRVPVQSPRKRNSGFLSSGYVFCFLCYSVFSRDLTNSFLMKQSQVVV